MLSAVLPSLEPAVRARAVVALEGAEAGPLVERLRPIALDEVSDRRLHALAALEAARFAIAITGKDEAAIEASAKSLLRSWASLGQRGHYLAALAAPVLGASTSTAGEVAARIGLERVIAALLERAAGGADLGGLLRAIRAAESIGGEAGRRATRARLEALDLVLDPLRRTLDELATRRPSEGELVAAFAAIRAAWRRCDRDLEIEVLAVERIADFAWDLYRERKFPELARIVEEIVEPSSSLATRVEHEATAIAWAAPCAQVLVFRAELAPRFDAQVELAERAHRVCPTLRNARLVLGDFLLTRAERAIDRNAARTTGGTTPEDDVARAASIQPDLKRLPVVREKLARRGVRA